MESQSAGLAEPDRTIRPKVMITPLCEKLQQHIRDASGDNPVKRVFSDIWKQLRPDYDHMVKDLIQYLEDGLSQRGIDAFIEGRAKTIDSVARSIERREAYRMREKNQDEYRNIDEILGDLHDLAGVRIVLDYRDDTDTVNKLISSTFQHVSKPNIFSRSRKIGRNWNTWFGAYESWNHHVRLNPAAALNNLQQYNSITFEVQLTTLSESLYNKLAHPLIYKQPSGTLSRDQEMMVDVAHGSAMIYAMCTLCLREKKSERSDEVSGEDALRDAARKVVGNDGSDEDNELLANIAPGGRGSLAGQTMPGRALLAAASPMLTDSSTDDLQLLILNAVRTALDETKKTPPMCFPTVEQARFDTEEAQRNRCQTGTRVEVLSRIRSWARKPTETLLWLQAPAGSGKSTIARTLRDVFLADSPEKLVAGYFFKRGDAQRNLTNLVFSTIASQLMETIPQFCNFLHKSLGNLAAVGNENIIQTKSLDEQFKILISTPLSQLNAVDDDESTRIIVIDALDECTDLVGIDKVLELLSTDTTSQLRLRVIVTSRPTARILDSFQSMQETGISYATVKLHDEFKRETEDDIRTFLTKSFGLIKTRRRIHHDPWPEVEVLNQAIAHATPLFIYATTLIRFIDPPGSRVLNPTKQLESWFRGCHQNKSHLSDITKMYRLIMEGLLYGDDLNNPDQLPSEYLSELQQILGSLVVLAEPLSVRALTALLDMDRYSVSTWLSNLQAVIHVPSNELSSVEIIHKSFSDFLVDDAGSKPDYRVNKSEAHLILAKRCMRRMSIDLHKNICKLNDPGIHRMNISRATITEFIPVELEYASSHWVHHYIRGGMHSKRQGEIEVCEFLKKNLLFWFEVLSILGKLPDAGAGIGQLLRSAVDHQLVDFLKECQKFLLEFGQCFEQFPLQIYGTGLIFSPLKSMLRQLFWDSRLPYFRRARGTSETWNSDVTMRIESEIIFPLAATISPDGRTMAVGGMNFISTWDIGTGIRQESCQEPECIIGLSFLDDNKRLASVSNVGDVLVWDLTTGIATKQCQLSDHYHKYEGAFLLPAHSLVVTWAREYEVSPGETMYKADLWNLQSGEHRRTPRKFIWKAAFFDDLMKAQATLSPHGDMIAAAAADGIRLWSTESGDDIGQLAVASPFGTGVAFAPNNHVIAATTMHGFVHFWDLASHTCYCRLNLDISPIALEFFPTSDRLALTDRHGSVLFVDLGEPTAQSTTIGHEFPIPKIESMDKHVVVCNLFDPAQVSSGAHYGCIEYPGFIRKMALSPDQKTLATTSNSHNLLLWDIESGRLLHSLQSLELMHSSQSLELVPSFCRIAFSNDGINLAMSNMEAIQVWELATGRCQWSQVDSVRSLLETALAFSPNGKMLAAGNVDKIQLWATGTGLLILEIPSVGAISRWETKPSWQAIEFAFLSNVTMLVSFPRPMTRKHGERYWKYEAEYDVQIVELRTGAIHFQTELDFRIHDLQRFANGKIVAIKGNDTGELRFYDAETNTVVSGSDLEPDSAFEMRLENCGIYMVGRWALRGIGKAVVALDGHKSRVPRVSTSAGNRLVSASRDGEFMVIDIDDSLINDI
ncbi:hypothetical protein EDB81DRAFT_138473 [Dactylonectria macrodidyma]|uniref:RelA/SpoT domain-containing protein n=1 Tax=Dactylonectria macrodidyma TaxID=307937 RepID=A0A9P9E198_9HYPO|nr:hypothetical protein EDB81DRAFT_138473 [Dactylonectria macrodidyma]